MKFVVFLAILVFLFNAGTLVFADTAIRAEVDKTRITTDELLTYKLTVTSSEKNVPAPKISGFNGLVIVSQAQSSTVSFQKGSMQTILVFVFILLPKETGKIKIEPAVVTVKGKAYASQACQIEVKEGSVRLPKDPGAKIPESDLPQYSL